MERFELHENGLNLVFEVTDEREIKFLHFSACPFEKSTLDSADGITGVRLAGAGGHGNPLSEGGPCAG